MLESKDAKMVRYKLEYYYCSIILVLLLTVERSS